MRSNANNITFVGTGQYHYARVSLAIDGKHYQRILHEQVTPDDFQRSR